jgi:serine protease DegS
MKIITNGRVIRGYLGVSVSPSQNTMKGFAIDTVEDNSPAFKAGLKPGDIIYEINNVAINSFPQALDIVAETKPGTTLPFKLVRKKQLLEVSVTIAEKPKS